MQNGISGLKVGDQWCDDPVEVKTRVEDFFEKRFSMEERRHVKLDNVRLKS